MKIIIEIDETKDDCSYLLDGMPKDNRVTILDNKKKVLIRGIFAKHTVIFNEEDKAIKTIFELADILEVRNEDWDFIKYLRSHEL